MADFFEENTTPEAEASELDAGAEAEGQEKIKLGDDEFDTDELKTLVDLGKIGKEAQEKFNTDLTKVYPSFTKTTQELKEAQKKLQEFEEKQTQTKIDSGQTLSQEEQQRLAREQAKQLGIVTNDDINQHIEQFIQAKELVSSSERIAKDAEEKYGIKTSSESILQHMQETGIRSPEKALKDKYENQIDQWKEQQFQNNKRQGLVTENSTNAGSKAPIPVDVTSANLQDLVRESLQTG